MENRRRYMDWLGKKLGVTKLEDWYNIDRSNLEAAEGSFF
jgi:hypothetical protein